jgi:hypothetical protein
MLAAIQSDATGDSASIEQYASRLEEVSRPSPCVLPTWLTTHFHLPDPRPEGPDDQYAPSTARHLPRALRRRRDESCRDATQESDCARRSLGSQQSGMCFLLVLFDQAK